MAPDELLVAERVRVFNLLVSVAGANEAWRQQLEHADLNGPAREFMEREYAATLEQLDALGKQLHRLCSTPLPDAPAGVQ